MSRDDLSALETAFLWFERPGRPVDVGVVAVFEGGPLLDGEGNLRLDELRELIGSRLDEVPRLRQRIAPGRSRLARPRWVDDPAFDLARHVDAVAAPPPGDDAALRRVAQEAHAELFDPAAPPWQMRFVTGLTGGRVGLVERAHHSLVDGVGGVDVAAVFLDLDRAGRPPQGPPAPAEVASPAPPEPPLIEAVGEWLRGPVQAAGALLAAARHPTEVARAAVGLLQGVAGIVGDGLITPSASINVAPGRDRRLAWLPTRLDDVRAAGHAVGGTVNDVVLAAVTAGLRALLVERRVPLPHDLTLKALVPVNRRSAESAPGFGNEVSAVLAPLPVGDGDPARRLATIVATMRRLKAGEEARTVDVLLHAADLLPAPLARTVVLGVEHQPLVNLVVTNVPGPPCPLYLMGAELLEAWPVLPLSANLSMGVAILSYAGGLNVGITADRDACPDLDVFATGVADGFAALGVPARGAAP